MGEGPSFNIRFKAFQRDGDGWKTCDWTKGTEESIVQN